MFKRAKVHSIRVVNQPRRDISLLGIYVLYRVSKWALAPPPPLETRDTSSILPPRPEPMSQSLFNCHDSHERNIYLVKLFAPPHKDAYEYTHKLCELKERQKAILVRDRKLKSVKEMQNDYNQIISKIDNLDLSQKLQITDDEIEKLFNTNNIEKDLP